MKSKNIIDDLSMKMMGMTNTPDTSDDSIIEIIGTIRDINMRGRDGRTLLAHSAVYNRINILMYLLERGADITLQDNMGNTPLHFAVKLGNIRIAQILLEHGASVNIVNRFGNIPLFEASHLRLDMIKLLLENDSDCYHTNIAGISPYKAFEAYPDIIMLMDSYKK